MSIPLFDCHIDPEGLEAACRVLASGQISSGAHVTELEDAVSRYMGGRRVVALANMTQAIEIALRLAGVRPGDDVLTLSFNCLSSNSAIHNIGARPIWVDIDPETGAMDVEDARSQITISTRALLVYYVGGYPADTTALRGLCDNFGIAMIEDANAAFGTLLPGGAKVGSVGDFAVFSFYANRQVNGAEGAALVCPTDESEARARRLRRFGIDNDSFRDDQGDINPLSDVPEVGIAGTLNNLNAALALVALRTIQERLNVIHQNASTLTNALMALPGIFPVRPTPGGLPANWVYMVLTDNQSSLIKKLRANGIGCSKLHQPNHVYTGFYAPLRNLPGTKRFSEKMVALPCGWWVDPLKCTEIIHVLMPSK